MENKKSPKGSVTLKKLADWSQSYDRELQRQRCENLQRN
jgi:hypothetical protein